MPDYTISRRRLLAQGAALSALGMANGMTPAIAATEEALVVSTRSGRLAGARSGSTRVFKGIPYAEPPVGPARFRAPRPPRPWKGIRRALAFGAPCIQNNVDHRAWVDAKPGSEDCLYLNVWTPAPSTASKPVMVWFHGGGFTSGSGGLPLYDGRNLAETGDVVIVTVNHRLNIFGYMWLGDLVPALVGDATPGQQDLVAALRWVNENIAAFGGDPKNVTIFGESGGGGKVNALLATPAARGLFQKAIVESGSQVFIDDRAQATDVARTALAAIGLAHPDIASLQSLPAAKLYDALKAAENRYKTMAFQPVVDGRFMPRQTWLNGIPPESADIPMIIGTNSDESAAFLPDMRKQPIDDAELRARLAAAFGGPTFSDAEWAAFLGGYRQIMPQASRLDLLVAMSTDIWMWHSAIHQAGEKAAHGGAPVYMYEFAWKTPCFGGRWALHGIEIPFVFGNLTYGVAWDGEDNEAERAAADPAADRFRLADQTMRAWAAFAHHGNPSTPALAWPAYENGRRATMILDHRSRIVDDPNAARRALVEGLSLAW